MNVLSREISCQVRLGGAALYLRNVSALFLLTQSPPPPPNPTIVRGRNAFQKVGPFTVSDVGCRPIFHLRL